MEVIEPYSDRTDLIIFAQALVLIAVIYITFYQTKDSG